MKNHQLIMIGAGAVLGYLAYTTLKNGAAAAFQAFNPTSDKNLAYRGVNAVGSALTGDEHFTLGGWVYELTHKEPEI